MVERERLVTMVCAAQKGESSAMTEIYDTFYNDLYYYILKTVKDQELALDLTQDAFIEIFQTIGVLKEPAAFVNWSKKVAYHRCTAYFKKRRELLVDENEDGQSVFDVVVEEREEFIPDEALDQEEFKKTIHEMIDLLPEEQRAAIMMRYFDEMSVKEIAEIQGVTEGTVKSRLNYGRKAIKQSVEDYEEKNNVKLHCIGVVPLLLWLARKNRVAKSMSLIGHASQAAMGIETTAGTGVKVSGKIMSLFTKKMIASIVAVVVAGGVLTTAIFVGNNGKDKNEDSSNIEEGEDISVDEIINESENVEYSTVYETTFGDTLVISAEPITEYNGKKADGESLPFPQSEKRYPREEQITKAIIIDELNPNSTKFWFAYLTNLESIEGLDKLNVSNVTNMESMFFACCSLENLGDLGNWDVSNVTNMRDMFAICESLTNVGDLSNWDVSNVTDMNNLFECCEVLTSVGDLGNWDVSNVINMSLMFEGCSVLTNIGDLSNWDVSNVEGMGSMFEGCEVLPSVGDLSNWDVGNVTDISGMFVECNALTSVGDLSNWDVSNVTNMNGIFMSCEELTSLGDLGNWDVSNVTEIANMFNSCSKLTYLGDLRNWNISNVTSTGCMFASCNSLPSVGDLSNWDVSNVTDMAYMFYCSSALTSVGDLSNWDVGKLTGTAYMFYKCSSLTSVGDLNVWDASNITYMEWMFEGCDSLNPIPSWYSIYRP